MKAIRQQLMPPKHTIKSPFPAHLGGKFVIDSNCYCGHQQSEHYDTLGYGHGSCSKCPCTKFTWESFEVRR